MNAPVRKELFKRSPVGRDQRREAPAAVAAHSFRHRLFRAIADRDQVAMDFVLRLPGARQLLRSGFPDSSAARPMNSFAEVFVAMKNLEGLHAALRTHAGVLSLQDFCTVEQLAQGPRDLSISSEYTFLNCALRDWDPLALRIALEFDGENDVLRNPPRDGSASRTPHLECVIAALMSRTPDEAALRQACCRVFLEFDLPCTSTHGGDTLASVLVSCGARNQHSGIAELATCYSAAGLFDINAPLTVDARATMLGLTPIQSAIQHGNAAACRALLDLGCATEAPTGFQDLLEYAQASPDLPEKDLVVAVIAEATLKRRLQGAPFPSQVKTIRQARRQL